MTSDEREGCEKMVFSENSWRSASSCSFPIRMEMFSRWRRRTSLVVVIVFGCFGFLGNSMGGDKFSSQGNALYKSLLNELIRQGICTDSQTCFNALQMYGEDGDRIYMNMYAQTDRHLGAIVASFILKSGLTVTGGMPITLRIFRGPKSQYLGIKSLVGRNEESVKLEVNK